MPDEKQCLLEEYKSLRSEILKRIDSRLYILYITIAIIGAILGFSLKDGVSVMQNTYLLTVLMCFSLIVIIAALIVTTQYTQQIMTMASYIIKYIEPEEKGLGLHYETRLEQLRYMRRQEREKGNRLLRELKLPLTSSDALALFYFLLTISVDAVAIYSAYFLSGLYDSLVAFIVVALLTCWSLFCSVNLTRNKSRNQGDYWKVIPWENVDRELQKKYAKETVKTK